MRGLIGVAVPSPSISSVNGASQAEIKQLWRCCNEHNHLPAYGEALMIPHRTLEHYSIAAQEDRSAPRTKIAIPAQLRASGARAFRTVVNDLSLSGFSAAAITRMHPGTVCWLTLPGLESLQAEVVWWENNVCGCAFADLLSPIVHGNILAQYSS